ncbi:hypothetical protein L228DRAFT_168209 [Xylona heveae TC161]|uniref:Uncharacterized protein n=1 Tax=Xylona heveae (strain CBS 132557 / TC161) TaxID=1328760 RepID=A0A165FP20_XYLHT|nr:hypothetical protein L228DRAFT_168209 [Xylona heveae TC161]KZF21211.1 hypothetical protein L228DRAFT_168209 [Xylona heveae TC161]
MPSCLEALKRKSYWHFSIVKFALAKKAFQILHVHVHLHVNVNVQVQCESESYGRGWRRSSEEQLVLKAQCTMSPWPPSHVVLLSPLFDYLFFFFFFSISPPFLRSLRQLKSSI